MDVPLKSDFAVALAKRKLRFPYRDALTTWAVELLERGLDSPALRILAGLDRNDEDMDKYLRLALGELDLKEPDELHCLREYVARIARDAVRDRAALRKGCDELYHVQVALGYPNSICDVPIDHDVVCCNWDRVDYGSLDINGVEKQARTLMEQLLETIARDRTL